MKVRKGLLIIAVLFVILNMVIATQYAVTKIGYSFAILHPSNSSIRLIGSDNSSDGIRLLRVAGSNITNIQLVLDFGYGFSPYTLRHYSAAFGIINEENYQVNITHINVSSDNFTYMKIYLHGNRTANANSTLTDPSSVFMWNNNTMVNQSNTTAWTLAAGDQNYTGMCYNTSDRANCTIHTPWDETAHVRYSTNNSVAASGVSDFVWVQITLDIPQSVEFYGTYTGSIWINFEIDSSG